MSGLKDRQHSGKWEYGSIMLSRSDHDLDNTSLVPTYTSEEGYLSTITDSDLHVMNQRIRLRCNKRDSMLQSLEGKDPYAVYAVWLREHDR